MRSTNRVSTEALRKSLDYLMEADLKFKSVKVNQRLYAYREGGKKKTLKEAVIVEGRYDKIKLRGIIDSPIIETNGFRVFHDSEKLSLIRRIAAARGILIFTDSDGAGLVIRNFLNGAVPKEQVRHCYIPQLEGKEKRKAQASKEGFLGVEGVSDEVIVEAIRKSGATIIGGESRADREISKADLYSLGLTGTENSAKLRKVLLKELDMPPYLSTNAMLTALNCLYSFEELKELMLNLG